MDEKENAAMVPETSPESTAPADSPSQTASNSEAPKSAENKSPSLLSYVILAVLVILVGRWAWGTFFNDGSADAINAVQHMTFIKQDTIIGNEADANLVNPSWTAEAGNDGEYDVTLSGTSTIYSCQVEIDFHVVKEDDQYSAWVTEVSVDSESYSDNYSIGYALAIVYDMVEGYTLVNGVL